jgi:tetratricopeptide (TPR) repeat protein
MSETFIPLGPFHLTRCIGRGGMAEVWSGVHAAQGVPVAVKVMTGERMREAQYRTAFRSEAQAVASLDHPGIVLMLDHGEVDAEAEAASRGLLALGSPYLAMELADHGTLAEASEMRWERLRTILLALLDALAHAHARGVVHRDLKPSNVLVFGHGEGQRLKLADFGLAQAVEILEAHPDSTEFVCGTPSYMAPEQLRGEWRDYGPWTDLYGLGCVAWMLACGRPPFHDVGLLELVRRQLEEEPPRFQPLFPVPPGFESWLRRLLEKPPGRRFVRAADAQWALLHLDAAPGPPPLPASWEQPAGRPPAMQLIGAGLGLYGLRTVPLIGRKLERDVMWAALAVVHATQAPRLVLLRGAAGNGKTRLAEWIAERAHEVGGAIVLRASHGPSPGAADGLPRMLARHLRCIGLSRAEVLARAERLLRLWRVSDEDEAVALADLMAPSAAADEEAVPPAKPQTAVERFALLERHLRRLSRRRPVVLLLDDVPWGLESIAFARAILGTDLPVLFLLTARDETLAERHAEAAALAELMALPGTATVEVPPLPPRERAALVQELLGLSGTLAEKVKDRTAGNPLFAVQLVGDWVQRGLLEVTSDGFVLRPGAEAQIPDDLHQVWSARVSRLLEGQPAGTREALEIAAALGSTVDRHEWEEACAAAGLPIPTRIAESLMANRLALRAQEGWSFVHNMLRETLERQALEAGRWPAHNRACAAMLAPRAAAGERGIAERLGRHLLLAGEWAAALEPLLRGAGERRETSDYALAQVLLTQRDEALAQLNAAPRDPRHGSGWVLRARIHLHQGNLDEVFRWAGQAVMGGLDGDWAAIRSESLRLLGDAARRRGDLTEAVRLYERCTAVSGDLHGMAGAFWGLGDVARQRGDLPRAAAFFARARELYEEIGDAHGVADHWIGLADLSRQKGDLDDAERYYRKAESRFAELGNQYGTARGRNGLGEVARMRGDLVRAAGFYRGAITLLTRVSSADEIFPRVNLALVDLAAGDFPTAAKALQESRDLLAVRGWGGLQTCVRAALLPCAAQARDWQAWDKGYDFLTAALRESGVVEPDVLWAIGLAAEVTAAAAEDGRAAAARRLLEMLRSAGGGTPEDL